MDLLRREYVHKLERLLWEGEITEEEAEEMMREWEEGYALACEEAWEAANDR